MNAWTPPPRASAAVVALLLTAAGCVDLGTNENTTDTTRPRATGSSMVVPQVAERPPKTIPGGFAAPLTLEGIGLKLTEIAKVDQPTAFTSRPGWPHHYVTERPGRVRQLSVDQQRDRDGNVMRTNLYVERGYVLDIAREVSTDGERGLLGLAFSSDGRTLFVSFTDRDGRLRVSSWKMGDYAVDTSTRRDLLTIDHPNSDRNGGRLALGADGFLYVATGDGGGPTGDGNAQNTTSLLGKILRIDPGGGLGDFPYGIPDSNPFRDGAFGAPEIYAYGMANPAHFSFDLLTFDLWVPDLGVEVDEVNELPSNGPGTAGRGANLGWNALQGKWPIAGGPAVPPDAIPPVFEVDHAEGRCRLVGGYVYRGLAQRGMAGAYVYGDSCTGQISGLITDQGKVVDQRPLGISVPPDRLAGFGETPDGELWVLSLDGPIYRIDPS